MSRPLNAQEEVLDPQGGPQAPPRTRAERTTTKNNPVEMGAVNGDKKDRSRRGGASNSASDRHL